MDGFLSGPPELIVEVAFHEASIELHAKKQVYRRAQVQEYIVWRTRDQAVDWWIMEDDEYIRLEPNAQGVLRSRAFPGLWLGVNGLIAQDAGEVLAVLHQGLASAEHEAFVAEQARRLEA